MPTTDYSWLLRMAWRDSRRNRGRLLLFVSSIILGIAALVAINSFGANLQRDIDREAKTLLGADLVLEGTQVARDSILRVLDGLQDQSSSNVVFISCFPKTATAASLLSTPWKGISLFTANSIPSPARPRAASATGPRRWSTRA